MSIGTMISKLSIFTTRCFPLHTRARREWFPAIVWGMTSLHRKKAFFSSQRTHTSNLDNDISSSSSPSDDCSTFPRKILSKRNWHNEQWEKNFKELIAFKEKHGDTLVPREYDLNRKLSSWVDKQRTNYNKSILSEEKIEILEKEGFVWNVHDLNWETRYQELVEYNHKHGDCNPPQTEEYYDLWSWVFVQRRTFSMREAGKPNALSDKRIEALNRIGFVFSLHEELWSQRFNELKDYKRNFGNCLVPKNWEQNRQLSKWVEIQRFQYKKLQDGQHSHLSSERIKQLDDIGFVWNIHKLKWNMKLEELREFFEMNGHCKVPKKYNKTLANWMRRQRSEYKKFVRGEKAQMDDERVKLLRSAGLDLYE